MSKIVMACMRDIFKRSPIALILAITGCADLQVTEVHMAWTGTQRQVTSVVTNAGTVNAGPFEVSATPLECPESQNFRPQLRHSVPGLAAGESVTFVDDFAPLARVENANLANVYGVEVRADTKRSVRERDETNNTRGASPRNPNALSGTQFNEGLATVLRGMIIDMQAARQLEIPAGHFHIREFRVSGEPSRKCVTLSIVKPYAELVSGASTLPRSEEPWVFSDIEVDEHTSAGKHFVGHDSYGHILSFNIRFGPSCFTVDSATINCVSVGLSTQMFTTSALNTCGMTTEPPFTPPSGN